MIEGRYLTDNVPQGEVFDHWCFINLGFLND